MECVDEMVDAPLPSRTRNSIPPLPGQRSSQKPMTADDFYRELIMGAQQTTIVPQMPYTTTPNTMPFTSTIVTTTGGTYEYTIPPSPTYVVARPVIDSVSNGTTWWKGSSYDRVVIDEYTGRVTPY
jgi:hypothetical protein